VQYHQKSTTYFYAMLIKSLPFTFIILILFCLTPCKAQPPTSSTFIGGGGDNNFSNSNNWNPVGVPTPGLAIIISSDATLVVDIDYTCTKLTLNNWALFNCTGGHILTITEGVYDGNGKTVIDVVSTLQVISSIKIPELTSGTFTDSRDAHVYKWVKIGTQIWMAENLAYNTEGGSWVYNDDISNLATYGRLYNWPTAMSGAVSSSLVPSGVQGVCPSGWHLPSDNESTILLDFLGGESTSGGKLKESGTIHWLSPNPDATDESGFTALPGGWYNSGVFNDVGSEGFWWSSTDGSVAGAYARSLRYYTAYVYQNSGNKGSGYSVRCVKN
jgi:uncharacterized protein (TIGR02145 family)